MEWDSADRSQGDTAKYPGQTGYSHSCVDKKYIFWPFQAALIAAIYIIVIICTYPPVWIRLEDCLANKLRTGPEEMRVGRELGLIIQAPPIHIVSTSV